MKLDADVEFHAVIASDGAELVGPDQWGPGRIRPLDDCREVLTRKVTGWNSEKHVLNSKD